MIVNHKFYVGLRDINSNWEFFFDTDGVFHFQKIPSGKVIVNNVTNEYGEPTPVVDHVIWDKTNISYDINTNFSDVKNYIEVYGKTHSPDEFCQAIFTRHTIVLKTKYDKSHYLNKQTIFGFGVFIDGDISKPLVLSNNIYNIILNDSTNTLIGKLDISSSPIIIGNKYYCIKVKATDTIIDKNLQFLGGLQSHAVAIENNPDSPFYVGQSTDYITNTMYRASFPTEDMVAIATVPNKVIGSTLNVNVSPWCSSIQFDVADIGTVWLFDTNVKLKGIPVQYIKVTMGSASGEYNLCDDINQNIQATTTGIYNLCDDANQNIKDDFNNLIMFDVADDIILGGNISNNLILFDVADDDIILERDIVNLNDEHISLDFSMTYMIHIEKTAVDTAVVKVLYHPIEGSCLPMSTSNVVNFPRFNKQVRLVCAGGEYDNIYSDDLAQQRARYEIYLKARLHDSINIKSVPIYWLDVNQIVDYTLPNNTTEENDYWLVKSISTDVSTNGIQSISAIRYYPEYSDISLYKAGRLKIITDEDVDVIWSNRNYAGAQMPNAYDAV